MSQHPQDLHGPAELAQQLAARGWIVRLELASAGSPAPTPHR